MPTMPGFKDTRKTKIQSVVPTAPVKILDTFKSSNDSEQEEIEFDKNVITALESERGQEATRKIAEHFKIRKVYRTIKR